MFQVVCAKEEFNHSSREDESKEHKADTTRATNTITINNHLFAQRLFSTINNKCNDCVKSKVTQVDVNIKNVIASVWKENQSILASF